MLLNKRRTAKTTFGLVSTSILLAGCGGGSSSSVPTAEITDERVATRIETTVSNVANCEQSTVQALRATLSSQALQDVVAVSRSVAEDANEESQTLSIRPSADFGSCSGNPGSVDVSSEHANGDTRYELVFDSYCATGPEGDTILTGTVVTNEDGSPTDSGPLISGTELSTRNLQVQYKDEAGTDQTTLVTIKDAQTDYGIPAIRGSGTPTIIDPDLTTIKEVTIDIETTGEVHELSNVSLSRHGGDTATITITSGTYITPDREKVDIATATNDPLIVDVSNGEITGGELIVSGSNDSVATISAGTESRVIEVSVNGEPLGEEVDCSNTDAPVKEIVAILLTQLPLY